MPIQDFQDNTFVCFTDISGFKVLLQHQRDRAIHALDLFYQTGYNLLQTQSGTSKVEGMFISDCGVLFVRPHGADTSQQLSALLSVVESLNRRMLQDEFMLTTAIAYGFFTYESRREFVGIDKNLMLGAPYVEAFLENEAGHPKLEPGQCRIIVDHLPINMPPIGTNSHDSIFRRLRPKGLKHLYFYWMRQRPEEIDDFEARYRDAYNLKYSGMLRALRGTAA